MILLGPPGTGKTHLAVALSIRACLAGQRVQFATATQWVARLSEAKRQGSLEAELRRLSFIPLLVVDEVGYIPFDPEAANLMFSLVSSRYERASMIVTSNKPFSAWGEIFGDDMAATAMIDRLIHHSEILSLKGDSYRLRGKDLDARIGQTRRNRLTPRHADGAQAATSSARRYAPSLRSQPLTPPRPGGSLINRRKWCTFRPALTAPRHVVAWVLREGLRPKGTRWRPTMPTSSPEPPRVIQPFAGQTLSSSATGARR